VTEGVAAEWASASAGPDAWRYLCFAPRTEIKAGMDRGEPPSASPAQSKRRLCSLLFAASIECQKIPGVLGRRYRNTRTAGQTGQFWQQRHAALVLKPNSSPRACQGSTASRPRPAPQVTKFCPLTSCALLRVVLRDHTGQKARYWLVLKEIIRAAPFFCVCWHGTSK
jgi:hypothetical protein